MNTLTILYAEFSTMAQENFHELIGGLATNDDNCETVMRNIAKASLIYKYKRDLNLPTSIRIRLSISGIYWDEAKHTLQVLLQMNDEIICEEEIINIMFHQSELFIFVNSSHFSFL